ncbi:MAG: hypothetical protein KDK70_03080 [Myxococcales bacterium]|nr:hypothetical protein [Myxococcales bacterium]
MALVPTMASAEPAIFYIPTEEVTLRPLNSGPCGGGIDSAFGCTPAVSEETPEPPYASADTLTQAVDDAFAEYDVTVTNTRPPEYISYVMVLPRDAAADMSQSFSCTTSGINCGARGRNDLFFVTGSTMNCIDPEIVHATVYGLGRTSGLEGVDNPDDWMNYLLGAGSAAGPDYATPPMGFLDVCSDRVQQQGFNDQDQQVSLPLECTSSDHAECPDGMNGMAQQNSHQDLLLYYGTPLDDTDPPELSNVVPAPDTVLQQGDDLVLDVDITDADLVVGARWVVQSQALIDAGIESGTLSQCTNDACDANWNDASPLKATDSDWSFTLEMLPAGEYNITLEAADYHGNVAEMMSFVVTIEGGASGTTGDMDTDMGSNTNPTGGVFTSGEDSTGGGPGSTTSGEDEDPSGCTCRTTPAPGGAVLMLLGLLGLGTLRRRG